MRRLLLQITFVFLVFNAAAANELFLSDTLLNSKSELFTLLKSNDCIAKAKFLNQFYSPRYFGGLKSNSEDLKLDSIVVSEWSEELQKIDKNFLYTCSFEDEGKTVLVDILKWDATELKWQKASHNYYWFDESDRLKRVEFQEYVTAEYRLYTRIDYAYENGLLKYESKYDRIDEIEVWDEIEQLEYLYNTNNSLNIVYVNEWDTNEDDWIANFYRTYTYSSGKLVLETGYDYDYSYAVSIKKFELKYTYDTTSNLIEIEEFVPGWEEGVFIPERKQVNVFDSVSALISETFYNWSYDAANYIRKVKRLYSNEIDGGKIYEASSYLWSLENRKWEEREKLDYFSENSYQPQEIQNWDFLKTYMPVYAFNEVVCDKLEVNSYENGEWKISGWYDYYFSDETVVGIDEIDKYAIKTFPNPVNDVLNIEVDNFEEHSCIIRNLNGQIIRQKNFQSKLQLNLANIAEGVYIVELYTRNKRLQTRKIIKQ